MNAAKEIQAAEALNTKAAQRELSKDWDAAFELYIKAAQTFLHLARTLPQEHTKGCRAAAGKALERAELIKRTKRDVRPIAIDPYSIEEQSYILDKSALINGLRYPLWQETDGDHAAFSGEPFRDLDGQPALPVALRHGIGWRSTASALPQQHPMTDVHLTPEHIVQNAVTDCSFVAAIVLCLVHHGRFGSKLGMSSMYPQDATGFPVTPKSGMHAVRLFINGGWRKSVVDDSLPFLSDGTLLGVRTIEGTNVLWPSLLEKSYMKVMGGYDFPGSNSGADLHALVGWIPEHIYIRRAGFQMESTWTRILEGFSKGHCLVTLGTPASVEPGMSSDNLIPAHDYAVMDIQDDGSEQHIALLDPWRRGDEEQKLRQESGDDVSSDASPLKHLTWRDICNRFDTIHISWDPSRFSRRLHVHGLWKPHKSAQKSSRPVSNRIRVFINGVKGQDEELWVLLTRHIVDKQKPPAFVSLNVVLDDDSRNVPVSEKPSVQGTYSDGLHYLRRLPLAIRHDRATIIATIDKADAEVGFTVTMFSNANIVLDTQVQKGLYSKTLEGVLTIRNCGGNSTYPTFMINPQYRCCITSDESGRSTGNMKYPVRFALEGPKELALNLKFVWSKGDRITEIIEGDIACDTGAYSYGMAYGETELKAGEYTVVVSSFEPYQQGSFELSICCLRPFELESIPAEGAGMFSKVFRGAWDHESSAGAPNFGHYFSNPILEVSIPNAAQVIVRLQLVKPSISAALNVTLFATDASGRFTQKVLTSGPYSDATSGALISRSAISAGKYFLIPSTYTPNVQVEYQVLLYSTVSGVELRLRPS